MGLIRMWHRLMTVVKKKQRAYQLKAWHCFEIEYMRIISLSTVHLIHISPVQKEKCKVLLKQKENKRECFSRVTRLSDTETQRECGLVQNIYCKSIRIYNTFNLYSSPDLELYIRTFPGLA